MTANAVSNGAMFMHRINKIIIVNSWAYGVSSGSGATLFAERFSKELVQSGFAVEALRLDKSFSNYHVYLLKRIIFNFLLALNMRAGRGVVLGFDFDGVFIPRRRCYFVALPRGIFADMIRFERGLYRLSIRISAFLEGMNLRRADLVVVPSEYAKQSIITHYRLRNATPIAVIPNGFDTSAWEHLLREQLTVTSERKRILAVAKLYPRKKMSVLIEALGVVVRSFPGVVLDVVGGGVDFKTLQKLVLRLNLGSWVTLHGDLDDRGRIAALYKNCDIFCHPSVQETFGNVLLEAMASGKPIVAARAASIPEIICDGVNGLLFAPDDVLDLANKLLLLLRDEALCVQLGNAGYAIVKEKYRWDACVALFMRHLAVTGRIVH